VAKVRVYELAKEFGVESKAVMAKLREMGEFVRSASSTIEAPVVRRLTEAFTAEQAVRQQDAKKQKAAAPGADGQAAGQRKAPSPQRPAAAAAPADGKPAGGAAKTAPATPSAPPAKPAPAADQARSPIPAPPDRADGAAGPGAEVRAPRPGTPGRADGPARPAAPHPKKK